MNYIAIRILLSMAAELPIMRATYKILRMHSPWLYVILHVALSCLAFFCMYLPVSMAVGSVIAYTVSALILLVLPLALSTGPLRTRLARICLICLGATVSEFVGSTTYSLISGGQLFPTEINDKTIHSVVFVYSLLIVLSISVHEVLIALCARFDRDESVAIELPVIVLPLLTYLLLHLLYIRSNNSQVPTVTVPLLSLLCSFATMAICVGLIAVARQEAEHARDAAEATAITRQNRHVRSEVEASVHRTMGMSRLRHDLANQVEVVERLTAQGNYTEADRYLELLQLQARDLTGEDHE